MAKAKKLQENGIDILPVTHESVVFDDNGVAIPDKYQTIEDAIHVEDFSEVIDVKFDKIIYNDLSEINNPIENKLYNVNGDIYKITNRNDIYVDNEYVFELDNGLYAINKCITNDFKQSEFKGIAVSISTNQNDYHLTQINNQINTVKEIGCGIQLAVAVTVGNITPTSMELCVTEEQLIEIMNIIYDNNCFVNMIKLHFQTTLGGWNDTNINPSSTDSFKNLYLPILQLVAKICNKFGVNILMMANEQLYVTQRNYYSVWNEIINALKSNYPNLKLGISYTLYQITSDLQNHNLVYSNCVSKLLDYIGLNSYPTVLRKTKAYNYNNAMYDCGLTGTFYNKNALYTKENLLTTIMLIQQYLGKVIITECGASMYDVTSEILASSAGITNETIRTGTLGNDQYEWFRENLPWLMNIADGFYVWGANAPFTPQQDCVNYLKNVMKGVY